MQWWMRPGPSRACAIMKPPRSGPSRFVDRHAAVLVADLAVAAAAGVAHHRDRAHEVEAGRVGRDDDLALRARAAAALGFVTAITIAKRAPTAPDVNHLWPLIT